MLLKERKSQYIIYNKIMDGTIYAYLFHSLFKNYF